MEVFRIARARYIDDLSGSGARTYGGRWNHKGTALIYTSESRALATVEYLVHVPLSNIPADLKIVSIHISDDVSRKELLASDLPANWREYPASFALADLGTEWAKDNKALLLRVPSAVVEREFNLLINPLHPAMNHVKVARVDDFRFDERLIRQRKK